MSSYTKILAAIDFSSHSGLALSRAVQLSREFGAELHVAHAFSLPIPLLAPYEIAVPLELTEQARQAASEQLRGETDKLSAGGLAATPHLVEAPAAPAIVQLAEHIEADLIVVGTRGHTGLKHVLLGSVAELTIRLATCDVLAVKEPETAT